MSLRLEYDSNAQLARYEPPPIDEDPLTEAALAVAKADARVGQGLAILPADGVIRLDLSRATSPHVRVSPDVDHTQAAFYVRTTSDLFGQMPWRELGDADVAGAKVSACALGALAMVQQNEVPTLKDAIEQAEACEQAATEISDAWKRRQPSAAPAADDILRGLSQGASKGTLVADDIARSARAGRDILVSVVRFL